MVLGKWYLYCLFYQKIKKETRLLATKVQIKKLVFVNEKIPTLNCTKRLHVISFLSKFKELKNFGQKLLQSQNL